MLKDQIDTKVQAINEYFKDIIPKHSQLEELIYEAMEYSFLANGKRLRPMLLITTCKMLGGAVEEAVPFAAALEMIHAYSLIHDDLPAMDDDDYRRGRLTNHKVYGEGMAILAGDALLNQAYETMIKACAKDPKPGKLKAMEMIADAAGTNGMIGGQVVDILSENKEIDEKTLLYIHEKKTSALIRVALQAGVAIAANDDDTIKRMGQIGYNVGVAFQIKDDILDVTSTDEVLGKPVGSDAKNGKVTYVSLNGLKKAKEDVEKLSQESVELIIEEGEEAQFLRELLLKLIHRDQ